MPFQSKSASCRTGGAASSFLFPLSLLLLGGLLILPSAAQAQETTPDASAKAESTPGSASTFSTDEVLPPKTGAEIRDIEKIVRDYLLRNPEVLVEALTVYEQRRAEAEERQRQAAVAAQLDALENDPLAPVAGNPDGDVVLVEFFDYRCPYCRSASEALAQAIEADDSLRVVFKEFPILGPESVLGARAALAADRQGKYKAFHFALMEDPGEMNLKHLRRVAEQVGMDPDRMERDMDSEEIGTALRSNHALAERLSIRGTPAFVIGGMLVPGAVNLEAMQRLIAEARAKGS